MKESMISAQGLSKSYRVGKSRLGGRTFREAITDLAASPFRRGGRETEGEMWALKDVSFDIAAGEVFGIVGRNGAGKSTLLKILARITEPTSGKAILRGRVGSLLEVGTGFHGELTGEENIYLSGAILGMTRGEIRRRFDDIVDFSGVGRFLTTPVKRYSSGMYLRLGFAVAAFLQPEILLVDEILAVGDVEFQKRCIGRMESVARSGRTVLLVSHSMSTVRALCGRALLLEGGRVVLEGSAEQVVEKYLSGSGAEAARRKVLPSEHEFVRGPILVREVTLRDPPTGAFAVRWKEPVRLSVEIEVRERVEGVAFGAGVRTIDGTHVFHVHHDDAGGLPLWSFEPGLYRIDLSMTNELRPGHYKLHLGADREHLMAYALFSLTCITLEVLDHARDGAVPMASNTGLVNGTSHWEPPTRIG